MKSNSIKLSLGSVVFRMFFFTLSTPMQSATSVGTTPLPTMSLISLPFTTEKLLVQPDPGLYHFINQGALTVDGIDDQEEMDLADVCNNLMVAPLSSFVLNAETLNLSA